MKSVVTRVAIVCNKDDFLFDDGLNCVGDYLMILLSDDRTIKFSITFTQFNGVYVDF